MILDMFSEEDIKVVVSYLPVWEFFFSMHVLSNPEHHVSRQKWVQSKEKCLPELVKEIRNLKTLTNEWILIIDSEKWSEIRQMEIIEMIRYFRKKNIYQWNHWVKETTGNEMTRKERDRILNVMEAYYETVHEIEDASPNWNRDITFKYIDEMINDTKQKKLLTKAYKSIFGNRILHAFPGSSKFCAELAKLGRMDEWNLFIKEKYEAHQLEFAKKWCKDNNVKIITEADI